MVELMNMYRSCMFYGALREELIFRRASLKSPLFYQFMMTLFDIVTLMHLYSML